MIKTGSSLNDLSVVGIGASAGGLRALEDFFDNIPADSKAAYVVIQHLSPDFKSLMQELLGKRTDLAIKQVTDGMRLSPSTIFLIPPGQRLILKNRTLRLTAQERAEGQQLHFPIDEFFQSMAEAAGERAIAIILSGTGSDGTRGIQHVSAGGGIVMVQAPGSAEFDGMPISAIATGLPDIVMPSPELARLTHQIITSPAQRQVIQQSLLNTTQLERIVSLLKRYENIDFSQYKTGTITRQVGRRCVLAGNATLEQYIQRLETSEAERHSLLNSLLVTVTHFFRDPKAWAFLRENVLPGIVAAADEQNKPIRVWVTACATGEEAYSVAIALRQAMTAEQHRRIEVKIFATDIDAIALKKASLGSYSSTALRNVTPEQLQTFFVPKGKKFDIAPGIREMVIFANHNLAEDASFTHIDLLSCRNVLIYMKPDLQHQVLRKLHFSLQQHGTLFLGESENLASLKDEFKTIQRRWNVYQKIGDAKLPPLNQNHIYQKQVYSTASRVGMPSAFHTKPPRFDPLLEAAFQGLLKNRKATCFLVDKHHQLVHLCGDELNLLRLAGGRASQDIFRMIPGSLHLTLRTALHRALQKDVDVHRSRCTIQEADYEVERVSIEVSQQKRNGVDPFLMVMIEAAEMPAPIETIENLEASEATAQYIEQLQEELRSHQTSLQATVEELEVINEEQQSTNEKLTASNEELQSTNEELHSVNEELYTVNAEYQSKIQELGELNNDLDNLIGSIDIGVVYLDSALRVRKFTPAATGTFKLVESDIGRPLDHLSHALEGIEISDLLAQAQAQGGRAEYEVKVKDNGPYLLMQIFPYVNENKATDGLILTLVNVDDIKVAQERLAMATQELSTMNEELEQQVRDRTEDLKTSQQLLQSITEATPNGIYIYDLIEHKNVYANSFLERLLGYSVAQLQALGPTINEHLFHPDDRPIIEAHHQTIIDSAADNHRVFESEYRIRDSAGNWHDFYSQDIIFNRDEQGKPTQILGTAIDVSELKANSIQLQESEARYRQLYRSTPVMMHSIDLTGTVLSASDHWMQRLGYTEKEVINQPILNLIDKRFHPDPDSDQLPAWLSPKGCESFSCQFVCKGGEVIDVKLSAVANKGPDGTVQSLLTVLVDVTEQNKAETEVKRYREHLEELVASRATELKETNEQLQIEINERIQAQYELDRRAESLERSNAELEQFTYLVSHDLQESLRAMTVFSQRLQQRYQSALDTTTSGYIHNIVEGGLRMQTLIDGILDFSRITHRGQTPKEIKIGSLVDTVLSSLSTTLKENNATVTVDELPTITADYHQISQLFQNLISNAIKFKHTEPPTIHISTEPQPTATPEYWLFSIKDNGIGISEDQQERIFFLFQRLHTRQELEGYGIGLAICKKIVERHGGRIWVESQPNHGSTFYFTLSVAPNDSF